MKKYSLIELYEELGISQSTWKRRKVEIQEYLKTFWVYHLEVEGRNTYYIVDEELAPLEKLPRKTRVKEIQEFYKQETANVIRVQPWNTGANVARTILSYTNPYDHKNETGSRYVRPILKEEYSLSKERRWCKLHIEQNAYIPISEEQEIFLKSMFKVYLSDDKTAEIISAQEAGYLTKDEAYAALHGNYNDAMEKFKERYGFRPIKVGEYIHNAFYKEY